ncbi:MAG: hypothetical protein AB203_02810 [Parcubacteria bacterium C7867-008]|nr:MAG: hypothetical protein AB203_02810 [Parcubacteria bacterium C7867-008]
MGCNIGYEQDGRSDRFWRLILNIRKWNLHLFIGIPLTKKVKPFPFYFPIGIIGEENSTAILSQTRPLSSKRLIYKVGMLAQDKFELTKKAASEYIFGS